jgi:sialidase-1
MFKRLILFLAVAASAAPNVLFIMVDDLRPELGCYGAEHVRSPHIDQLAASGRLYQRAYCQQAVCNPSRTSLMTGLSPDSIGITGNHAHFRDKQPDIVTLPQHFKQQGYHAAAIGKIYHGVFPDGASRTKWDTMGDPPSWSVPALRFGPRYYYTEDGIRQAKAAFAKSYPKDKDWTQKLVFGPVTEAPDVPDSTLYDGKVADSAIQALQQLTNTPFFLAIGFIKPHSPFVAPKKYWDLYDPKTIPLATNPEFPVGAPTFAGHGSHEMRRYTDQPNRGDLDARRLKHAYLACVSYIDAQVGRVLDELDRLKLADDTIVVLLGDHGYHLGEHGLWGKTTNFEADTRVPLIIRAPGLKPGPTPALAELLDLYPTLCEMAGVPKAPHVEGISLVSATRTQARSQYPRGKLMGYSTRSDRYRDTVWKNRDTGEIVAREHYDYESDPQETRNLAANFSFDTEAAGPFKTLKTALGTWTTTSGTCLVDDTHAKTGKHCLQLVGSVTLTLAKNVATDGELNFWAERWTSRKPFSFRIEKKSGDDWQEIYNGDGHVRVGRAFLSEVTVPLQDADIKQLRFTSTSPPKTGILIDDIRIMPAIPQRIVSVELDTPVLPAIAGRPPTPARLHVQVEGSLDPISVEGSTLKRGANEVPLTDASPREIRFSNGHTFSIDKPLPPQRPGIALRDGGDDGVTRYRIPGLVTSKAGSLLAVYDIRRRSGGDLPGDIDVGLSRSSDGGHNWEPMRVIMDMGNDPAWRYDGIGDPAILVDRQTGTIWVAATWSHGNRSWNGSGPGLEPEETGQLMLVRSDDDGKTWSKPINITKQVKRPEWCFLLQGPGAGITMADGTIVFAAQYQDPPDKRRLPHSTILYSKDHGKTWQVGTGAFDDTTESQVAEIAPGVLMLNCRYNRASHRVIMTTRDMGSTWQEHPTSRGALIEPRSCMAGLLDAGPWLLFSNPDSVRAREHITIKFSPDRGDSWTQKILLDSGRGAGYSCMSMIDSKTIGIVYEGSQSQLTFQRIPLPEVPLSHAPIFGDGMVLQRNKAIPIWGRGPVGDTIRIDDQKTTVAPDGSWRLTLPAKTANTKPQTLAIRSSTETITLADILIGDVWLCAGQSNMEWPLKSAVSAKPNLRFHSPDGSWTTDPKDFSAVSYYFGAELTDHPIGLIDISRGGTPTESWIREDALPSKLTAGNWLENPLLDEWCQTRAKTQLGATNDHRFKPGHMWRTHMTPLRGLAIAGALWYQGESNAQTEHRVIQHGQLFPLLVRDWRAQWGQGDFPILYVQLPALKRPHWPAFRDQQRRFLDQLPKLGMAITIDTGHPSNVHPTDKRPIGQRLARLARDIRDTGPLLRSPQPSGDILILHFDSQLQSADGQPIRHFEVASDIGDFHPALAKIAGDQIILRSDAVQVPHRARYAWQPYPEPRVNLVNDAGLPASPFTTD